MIALYIYWFICSTFALGRVIYIVVKYHWAFERKYRWFELILNTIAIIIAPIYLPFVFGYNFESYQRL